MSNVLQAVKDLKDTHAIPFLFPFQFLKCFSAAPYLHVCRTRASAKKERGKMKQRFEWRYDLLLASAGGRTRFSNVYDPNFGLNYKILNPKNKILTDF